MRHIDDIKSELNSLAKTMLGQDLRNSSTPGREELSALILEFMQAAVNSPSLGGRMQEADREDIVLRAVIDAAKDFPKFRGEAQCTSWLTRILINTTGNYRTSLGRRQKRERVQQDHDSSFAEFVSGKEISPIAAVLLAERCKQVEKAMNVLAERDFDQAAAVRALHMDGMTDQEAADASHIPVGTVKSRASRGREKIENILQRQGLGPEDCGPLR